MYDGTSCKYSLERVFKDGPYSPKKIYLTWLGPKCISPGGYNMVVEIQTEMSPWQQVAIKMTSF